MLKRVEALTLAAQQHLAVVPFQGDAGPVLQRRALRLQGQTQRGRHRLHESRHPCIEIRCHANLPVVAAIVATAGFVRGRGRPAADRQSAYRPLPRERRDPLPARAAFDPERPLA